MRDARPRGPVVPDWSAPEVPTLHPLEGRYVQLERMTPDAHAALLHRAFDGHDWVWDYMSDGPFGSAAQFHRWVRDETEKGACLFYAIQNKESGTFGGFASYLRIKPASGSIEVGSIALAPSLQRTRAATEAMYLMMQWAFDAGYRRYEWKCDALNAPSRRAAQRLGFSYEGVFVQATVVKGRNRDTAWFAVIDKDWPALQEAYQLWLSPQNFDAAGHQKERLADLTRLVRRASDPEQAGEARRG